MLKRCMSASIAVSLLFLSGCGSESGNSEGSSTVENLDDIVGVYEDFDTYGGLIDEYYIVINSDGTIYDYDYMGDAYDNEGNCYDIYQTDELTHVSGNTFYSEDLESDISFANDGDTLTLTLVIDSVSYTESYDKSSLLISDLTPECEW